MRGADTRIPAAALGLTVALCCLSCGSGGRSTAPRAVTSASSSADPTSQRTTPSGDGARRVQLSLPDAPSSMPLPGLTQVDVADDALESFVLEGAGGEAWLVHDPQILRDGLYAARIARRDPGAASVVLFDGAGRLVPLDADAVLATDGSRLLARRGEAPLLFQLPATLDGASLAAPLVLPAPIEAGWAEPPIAFLDASHVRLGAGTVRALPSFQAVAFVPSAVVIAGNTALLQAATAKHELYFLVEDAFTGDRRFTLPPPSGVLVDTPRSGLEGPPFVVNLSSDGTHIACADPSGLWIADLTAKTPTWRNLSPAPFASSRGFYGVNVSADNAYVCLTQGGNAEIHSVTASPPARASASAVAVPSSFESPESTCEVIYLPLIDDLTPLRHASDRAYTAIDPWLLDPARRWIAALYEVTAKKGEGDVELVLAEPSTGKLFRRVPIARRPPPRPNGEPMVRTMIVSPGPAGSIHVSVSLAPETHDVLVSPDTGDIVTAAPPSRWAGAYCLRDDGSLAAPSSCDPGR